MSGLENYSPLMRNTLDGFSEPAQFLYLKLLDVFQAHTSNGERKAFLASCEYEDHAAGVLDYIMRNNPVHQIDDKTRASLSKFFTERWRHNFMRPDTQEVG